MKKLCKQCLLSAVILLNLAFEYNGPKEIVFFFHFVIVAFSPCPLGVFCLLLRNAIDQNEIQYVGTPHRFDGGIYIMLLL